MTLDLKRHPCFNDSARGQFARIHLPVAPQCNVQCNFCNRLFDCANESRPGVTSAVLSPGQALAYLEQVKARRPDIAVVGIAGPGDPMANAEATLETLRLVRQHYPEMLLCVATNGLAAAPFAEELASLAVSHVTVTINALDPDVGAKIYRWVRDGVHVLRGRAGAELLLHRQWETVRALKSWGVTVKINSIFIPGVNDEEIPRVAEAMAGAGADIFNCVPLYPVEGTPFADITPPTAATVEALRQQAGAFLPLMRHCTRCRADAVGLLGETPSAELVGCLKAAALLPLRPHEDRRYVAVASHEGVLVNQHLGEAQQLWIYGPQGDGFEMVETRTAPTAGSGDERWRQLAETLHDCRALLTSSVGPTPKTALESAGIRCVMMEGLIEEGLTAIYRGEEIRAPLRRQHRCGSGAGCGGNGQGCM